MQPGNNSTHHQKTQSAAVPYTIPSWSEPPGHSFYLEVLKDGSIIDQLDVYEKGAYMFGRVDICDFVLEHPTISRFHAEMLIVLFDYRPLCQFYSLREMERPTFMILVVLMVLFSTRVRYCHVKKKVYTELHVGDVILFGLSTRLYVFQGPTELMLPVRAH
ncbi:Kanadaptin [Vitis vinifera]|uniref:Kanadaptin n=1 Tax=Vitis vinifera TaxID=29760 RepID=A0A438IMU2_VITVI|nr:Kanadaptin [Vitis vinifera]